MSGSSSSSMPFDADGRTAIELAKLQALPHSYRDAIKATLRARTNTVVEMIDLSMTTFAKLVKLPKKTVTLVLQNIAPPDPLVYAVFAQYLYAFDTRVVSSVVHALDPELNRTFHGLQDAPSETALAEMNPTEKAKALAQCLGNKKNVPILDKLARTLLTHFQLQGADLTLSTVKSYLNLSTPLLSRYYLDRQSYEVLRQKDEQPESLLMFKLADSNGQIFEKEEDEESEEETGESRSGDESDEVMRQPTAAKRTSTTWTSSSNKKMWDSSADTSGSAAAAASSSTSSSTKRPSSSTAPTTTVKMEDTDSGEEEEEDDDSVQAAAEAAANRAKARKMQQHSEQSKPQSPFISNTTHNSSNSSSSTVGVKRPRTMAAASAPRIPSASSSTSSHNAASTAAASSAAIAAPSRGFPRTYRPSQAASQSGFGQSTPYTAPIFLKSTMGAVLVRMIQVLERDGFSRRQVAVQIGISQSKISRLLHGRSPFRTPDEEFHLRHWVYRQEKQWVAGLDPIIKRATKENQELDLALLSSSLRALDPNSLIEYLDFVLPLDKRKAIDKVVALALGIDSAAWSSEAADVETEEMRLIREADELAAREAMEDDTTTTTTTSAAQVRQTHSQAEPGKQYLRPSRGSGGFGQMKARSTSDSKQRREHHQDENENEHEDEPNQPRRQIRHDSDSDMSSGEDERKEAEDEESEGEAYAPPAKKVKRPSALFDDNNQPSGSVSVDYSSENPSGPTCGLDAWTEVNYASARHRVQLLMSLTNVSQTVFAKLLEISSGTVSMILRGIFRFSSLGRYLGKLRVWGRATDQLLVMKALSILGADHHTKRDPISNPNQYPEAHLMREERKDSEDDDEEGGGDNPKSAVIPNELVSQALEELAILLADADIMMENEEAAAYSDDSSQVLPLSLWSWLNFRCDFHERHRLDEIMLPWVERWSAQGQDDEDMDETSVSLEYQQTESLDRFQEFLSDYCQGCNPPQALKVH